MDSNIKVTPTSSTTTTGTMARSISTQPSSLSSEKNKYGFRQQLKRFVGWGNSKPKKPLLTPLTTSQNGPLDPPPLLTGSTLVSNSVLDSPSDMSFVSAPSTPLPPTPCTPHSTVKSRFEQPRLEPTLSRRTSVVTASEVAMSVISASKSRLSTVSSISTCSVTTEELNAQEKVYISDSDSDDSDDDDVAASHEDIVQEQVEIQNEVESDDIVEEETEIKNLQDSTDTTGSIVESEPVVQDTTKQEIETPTVVTTMPPPPPPPKGNPGEFNDIQAQYAMWMNSQPPEKPSFANNEQLPPTPASSIHSPLTKNVLKTKPSAISEKSVLSTSSSTPSIPPSNNSNNNTMMTSPSNVSTSSSSCASTCSGTTAFTAISTNKSKEMTREFQEPLHPMPSSNEQDLDDLFLLVAHGVDFLTTKENTKWEEEGGYEFHPWNRPQSSFAVRYNNKVKKPTHVPAELTQTAKIPVTETEDIIEDEKLEEKVEQEQEEEDTEELVLEEEIVASQESLVSVAKRILGAKSEPQTAQQSFNSASNEHQSVDDDELQRIVASHIVF
ncbi:hypothetical protein K501DRAFT_265465 [Backusella circina FSU 941]|nr:hypothetical protein K501DRAFT_265465 [Backusella circina FSU 941]